MTGPCECGSPHPRRRIVLTGGPGAGKTAVLEVVRQSFCRHVRVLPEAAGILFGGGFPRDDNPASRRAAQRAIYYTQLELESIVDDDGESVTLCDRGTVDGGAYWPGPGDLWSAVGTTRARQLSRYDAVIHLRTPSPAHGYNRANPLRIESAPEAVAIDDRILSLWDGHPRRVLVEATLDFLTKAGRAIEAIAAELPACCRRAAGGISDGGPSWSLEPAKHQSPQ